MNIHHVVAGMHIGSMTDLGLFGPSNIDAVLSIGSTPGVVPEQVKHRHMPLSYQAMDTKRLEEAVIWVLAQIEAERTVLIRSEGGRQRPGLVAGMVILHLGGRYYDALSVVKAADIQALSDFRYTALLKEAAKQMDVRQASRLQ